MKLIVGLGNPGREYVGTRHNVGFEVIEMLAKRHAFGVSKQAFRGAVYDGRFGDERVLLLRPLTYMNLSGDSVAEACRFHKIEPSDVIIISDDVALPRGRLRLRMKGSAGGHNGLANIIARLGTNEIARVRIGVGAGRQADLRDHVLGRFKGEEIPIIEDACILGADAIEYAVANGFEAAMNRYNIGERSTSAGPDESNTPEQPADESRRPPS